MELVVTDSLQRQHSVSSRLCHVQCSHRCPNQVLSRTGEEREHFISNKHQDFSINEVMATSSGLAGTLTETAVSREENTTLKLKLTKKKQTKKIQWTEDTVDNEGIESY